MRSPQSEDLAIFLHSHPYDSIWVEHFSDGRATQVSASSFYQLCHAFNVNDDQADQAHYLEQCTRQIRRDRQVRRANMSGAGQAHTRTSLFFNGGCPLDSPFLGMPSSGNTSSNNANNSNNRITKMQILVSGKQNVTLLFNQHPNDTGYTSVNYVTYRATVKGRPPRIITEYMFMDLVMPEERQWWINIRNNSKAVVEDSTVKQLSKCTIGL